MIYEQHFAMTSRPFKAALDIARYFPAAAIDEARQRMALCIERGDGPAVVVGPSGTGKTLLLEVIAETYRQRLDVVLLAGTMLCTRRALLQRILHGLGLPYANMGEGELRLALIDHLQGDGGAGRRLLLLVDEAQSLPLKLLEELRMLTNMYRARQACVQLVLAGPALLEERLAGPRLELFQHRIAARCYLEPFDCAETQQYIRSQLAASGARESLLDEDAIDAVFRATDGVPRLINQLADHALLLAAIAEQESVTRSTIEEAWSDLQQLPSPTPHAITTADEGASVVEFGTLEDFDTDSEKNIEVVEEPVEALACQAMPPEIHDPMADDFVTEEIVEDRYAKAPVAAGARCSVPDPFTDATARRENLSGQHTCAASQRDAAKSCGSDDRHEEAESEPPLAKLEPVPLVVQPDADLWNTDPVYPEYEQIHETAVPSPRLEVVGWHDSEENPSDAGDRPSKGSEPDMSGPVPVPAREAPCLGQLFASLYRARGTMQPVE